MAAQPQADESCAGVLLEPLARLPVDDSKVKARALRQRLVRRATPDHSQLLRHTFQFAFLLLDIWLGSMFCFWVHGIETGAHNRTMVRPAGVEGWLPIAGLMNLKYWMVTGRVPAGHPAAASSSRVRPRWTTGRLNGETMLQVQEYSRMGETTREMAPLGLG